jgi:hypothetical protein
VSSYCERVESGLWAEPLNALSNLAFVVAAILAMRSMARMTGTGRRWDLWLAVVLLWAVALGSSLWHTVARPWAAAADAIPIGLLVTTLLGSVLHRLFAAPPAIITAALVALQVVSLPIAVLASTILHGSLAYTPALLSLTLLAAAAAMKRSAAARSLLLTTVIFLLSLTLRTLDLPLCEQLSRGTHFLWHMLNAAVLYRLLVLLIRHQPSGGAARPAEGQ